MHKYILKLYYTILSYSSSKYAIYVLSIVSFIESSFFIFPPDLLLLPMILAKPQKAFLYAFVAGFFSVLGGILGYFIGYYFYEHLGKGIINFMNYQNKLLTLATYYEQYESLAIFIAGFTPFPYKIITLFSGFIKANFFIFVILSIVSRFSRFFLLAGIVYYFGDKTKYIISQHIGKITIIFTIFIMIFIYIFLL